MTGIDPLSQMPPKCPCSMGQIQEQVQNKTLNTNHFVSKIYQDRGRWTTGKAVCVEKVGTGRKFEMIIRVH